ncbi:DUF551 domain-containing protein [Arsenophonus sp. PmNCSU2021_1]|uniref:DUF551 domain-containing protein n=1 Tax=Arsenophonus sp. PmNCSU2021_1 TaxID=3118989 RepID=UPI002FF08361
MDELPLNTEDVLVCTERGNVLVGYYQQEYDGWYFGNIYIENDGIIKYWMPLPAPPEEEE